MTDGDHPYMKHWWVPGLQIGYEHTFIHQVADFLEALASGKTAAPTFRDGAGDGSRDRRGVEIGQDSPMGKSSGGYMILRTKTALVVILGIAAPWSYRLAAQQAAPSAPRNRRQPFHSTRPHRF